MFAQPAAARRVEETWTLPRAAADQGFGGSGQHSLPQQSVVLLSLGPRQSTRLGRGREVRDVTLVLAPVVPRELDDVERELERSVRADKRNVVVDLKPEGYQLLKLKEDILHHLAAGAREHLVTAFWEYLLLLEVAHKLLEKDRNTYQHNHEIRELYLSLESMYKTESFEAEGAFSERLHVLSNRLAVEYRAK